MWSGANLLLFGANVITLDPFCPRAEAVAIADGRIIAVGSDRDLRPYVSLRTERIHCRDRTILPGFIDPHLHLFAWASSMMGVELGRSQVQSIADIQRRLRTRILEIPPGDWVRAYGYDEFFLREKRHPIRWDLDAVSTRHPIRLRHRTGHASVLNSLGLQLAGIAGDIDFPGGVVEKHGESGQPTGVLYEMEDHLNTIIPPLPHDTLWEGMKKGDQQLVRSGVTSVHDASAGNTLNDFFLLREMVAHGCFRSRVTVMMGQEGFRELVDKSLPPRYGDERVRVGSIKFLVREAGTSFEDLRDQVEHAHCRGHQVAIHAVDSSPVCVALAAIEEALRRFPRKNHRHRIEHCALCPPPFIEKLAQLGVGVVTQPAFLYYYGDKYVSEVEPPLLSWMYRAGSFLAQGVPVAGSSDCPVAPIHPLVGVQAAVMRQSADGTVIGHGESVSPQVALWMFTGAGAQMGFEEDCKGSVTRGKYADLVVLEDNPLMVPSSKISEVPVLMTVINGEVVWSVG